MLPKRRAEFDYVLWDRPLRAAGSHSDWIRTLSRKAGIDVKEGGGTGLRRRDLRWLGPMGEEITPAGVADSPDLSYSRPQLGGYVGGWRAMKGGEGKVSFSWAGIGGVSPAIPCCSEGYGRGKKA